MTSQILIPNKFMLYFSSLLLNTADEKHYRGLFEEVF